MNNLFVLFTDRDGRTYQDLLSFDKLPYENKVVFTNKTSVYIPGFEKEKSVGNCFEYISLFSGKKNDMIFLIMLPGSTEGNILVFLEKTMYLKMDKKYYLRQ